MSANARLTKVMRPPGLVRETSGSPSCTSISCWVIGSLMRMAGILMLCAAPVTGIWLTAGKDRRFSGAAARGFITGRCFLLVRRLRCARGLTDIESRSRRMNQHSTAASIQRFFAAPLAETDPELAAAIRAEFDRQQDGIELIASE